MLPLKYVRDAKDDHTGDYIKEIAGGKDTHQVVEIVPLGSEPEDEADVAHYAQDTKQDLGGEESSRGVKNEYKAGDELARKLRVRSSKSGYFMKMFKSVNLLQYQK